MKSFFSMAVLFVLLFYGILLVLMPLALKWRFRSRARIFPRVIRFEDLPAAARVFVQKNTNSFELWGFDLITYLNLCLAPERAGPFLALLSNPHTGEWAGISYGVFKGNSRGYLGFITQAGDVQVETNTDVISSVLFPTPNRQVFRFPNVRDVFTLYRLHRMLVQQIIGHHYPVLPPAGQEVAELQGRLERYTRAQQARGYLELDWRHHCYRLTWKGAMVATWRFIWPGPLLCAWFIGRRTRAILKSRARAQQSQSLA